MGISKICGKLGSVYIRSLFKGYEIGKFKKDFRDLTKYICGFEFV